jgi:RNA polymerase sigma-70 factor (ECF subfamily)
MDTTSASLLHQLRQPDQQVAWQRFVELYGPLIYHWGRGQGLKATDAADLVQEVMATLVTKLRKFEYDETKRFRGWLRTVTVNAARNFRRRESGSPTNDAEAAIHEVSVASAIDLFDEAEYRSFLVQRALELMRAEFPDHAWRACWSLVVEGRSGREIAAELGISENSVYVSKCRILKRLREELAGLLD